MQYREILLDLIFNKTDDDLTDWLDSLAPLDKVDAMNDLAQLTREMLPEEGNDEMRKTAEVLEQKAAEYQEATLDVEFTSLQYELAIKERDMAFADLYENIDDVRELIENALAMNTPEADSLKELALAMIHYEQSKGFYAPLNWLFMQ